MRRKCILKLIILFQYKFFQFSMIYIFVIFNSVSTAVTYDKSIKAIKVKVPDSDEEFFLHPATVRRNDRSAKSVVCLLKRNSVSMLHDIKQNKKWCLFISSVTNFILNRTNGPGSRNCCIPMLLKILNPKKLSRWEIMQFQ